MAKNRQIEGVIGELRLQVEERYGRSEPLEKSGKF